MNARIYQQTGWQLATVNMIIPAELFFTCHSLKFFPVTTFMRPLEQDYLQEPDIGHDVAGHVATFTIPTVAAVMQQHGDARNLIYRRRDEELAKAKDASQRDQANQLAEELLRYAERIYWFTVEFGLVLQDQQLRGYGAGILSSPGETVYSIESPIPNRVVINPARDDHLLRLVRTAYMISEFQKTYFVTESFEQLSTLTAERIVQACQQAVSLEHFSWRDLVPGDHVWSVGEVATTVDEKYLRLDANKSSDACEADVARRNLQLRMA